MNKVIKLYPRDPSGRVVELDASLLVFAPMAEIRYLVDAGMRCASDHRLFARVFRIVAQMLIESMIAPQGERTERFGLHAHNAGRRAIELLDLAQELDDASPTKEGA